MNWYKISQFGVPETAVSINVYPQEPLVKEVVDELERANPGYFKSQGIKEIRLNMGGPEFGHVEFDPKDPNKQKIIFIEFRNIQRAIQNAAGSASIDLNALPPEAKQAAEDYIKQEIQRQIGSTLAHERGHIYDLYSGGHDKPFGGGEFAAEQESHRMGY